FNKLRRVRGWRPRTLTLLYCCDAEQPSPARGRGRTSWFEVFETLGFVAFATPTKSAYNGCLEIPHVRTRRSPPRPPCPAQSRRHQSARPQGAEHLRHRERLLCREDARSAGEDAGRAQQDFDLRSHNKKRIQMTTAVLETKTAYDVDDVEYLRHGDKPLWARGLK